MKILIIEDEQALNESILFYLKNEGFVCETALNYIEASQKINDYDYDVIVVDIMLPDGSGLDIVRELKANYLNTGIIILSAKDSLDDKLLRLDLGADDYITKPFHLAELNSRIKSVIRRRKFNGNKEIILRKNMVESRDLKEGLIQSMWIVFVALLLILMVSNYFMSKKIWSSFYRTIHKINRYDLTKNEILELPPSKITELAELNQAIRKMSEKIRDDYLSLKEFSENASHEIQTPLSIIKSKTELLFQWEGLTEEQLAHIQAIDQAATKLSRLNHSLLLLTKIENRQFEYDAEIDLKSLIEAQLKELDEFVQLQQITVQKQTLIKNKTQKDQIIHLFYLTPLLTNAIRYCSKPGTIQISLDASQFVIANTGAPLNIRDEQIFDRFKKEHQSSDSLGLGLYIVKKICDFTIFRLNTLIRTIIIALKLSCN